MNTFKSLVAKQSMISGIVLIALTSGYYSLAAASRFEKANKYWLSGYKKQKSGDHDGAIADYTKANKSDPTCFMGYRRRASERVEKGDYDGAIADATKCIELAPNTGCYYI